MKNQQKLETEEFDRLKSAAIGKGRDSSEYRAYAHFCCHKMAYSSTIGDPSKDPCSGDVQMQYRELMKKHMAVFGLKPNGYVFS